MRYARRLGSAAAMLWLLASCGSDPESPGGSSVTVLPPSAAGATGTNILPAQAAGASGGFGNAPTPAPTKPGMVSMPPVGNTTPPPPPVGNTGGAPAMPPMAGAMAAGSGTAGQGGSAAMPPPMVGGMEPKIPALTAECPTFKNGTITFMSLGGITISAGAKGAAPTAPMVFYWHGTGSTAGEYAFMATAVNQGVVSEGGVLISFQGTTGGDLLSGTSIFVSRAYISIM